MGEMNCTLRGLGVLIYTLVEMELYFGDCANQYNRSADRGNGQFKTAIRCIKIQLSHKERFSGYLHYCVT